MKPRVALLTTLTLALILFEPAMANIQPSARLIVSPAGPYRSIDTALNAARDGDTIEVRGGVYGAIVVEKSVTLEGVDWPVIDGGGQGTVVTLSAPHIILRGFEVRGSGVEPDRDHAGITLTAAHIMVENNRLRDVLFGVFVAQADDAIVRDNDISSKTQYDEGRKGDGIRVWYSQRVSLEHNHVHEARDVVIWYSSDIVMRDNVFEHGRYGVHLMYCDRAQIERNQLINNSVGIYTMYSNETRLRDNLIRGSRGPSGYALGFKDASGLEVSGNVLVDNRVGIFLDSTPFGAAGIARHAENILAFNDIGMLLLPAVHGNLFEANTFWENGEQVAVQGGGVIEGNEWRGNYWSDYTGFDADGNGMGDASYQAEHFFESLTDREPRLQVLIYSPAVQAIELAATTFPIVRPQPKLSDLSPRMQPAAVPTFAISVQSDPSSMALVAIVMIALGIVCGSLAFLTRTGAASMVKPSRQQSSDGDTTLLVLNNVGKRYGKTIALDGICFDARRGEAVALWGPNGAGKTTLLKAILGLIEFQGGIRVSDYSARYNGKRARSCIGYVPQESVFYDARVLETMTFYARLKQVDTKRIPALLEHLGLSEHAHKSVAALSGGLKQRLALAVALLADPPLLLLDEPTANLDARARRDYLALLSTLRREGKTIVFASHRLEELEALADRVIVLERGRIIETLTPEALRARHLPELEMTLWVPDAQRITALRHLESVGLNAHLNGRGTVVVQLSDAQKMQPLQLLNTQGIAVLNFELEQVQTWN